MVTLKVHNDYIMIILYLLIPFIEESYLQQRWQGPALSMAFLLLLYLLVVIGDTDLLLRGKGHE